MWLFLGFLFSAIIALAGYSKGALSGSGVVGAILIGSLTFGLGGWDWGVLLVAFFVSSSLLSRYRHMEKMSLAEKFAKGSRRDFGQTIANGGLGAILAIMAAIHPSELWLMAYVGVMATVNADTWATELGVLGRSQPRLITTGQVVAIGTSGGVSRVGSLATMAGGLLVGLLAGLMRLAAGDGVVTMVSLIMGGVLGGVAGSFFDSFLGATAQAIYYCDQCAKETERTVHGCGTQTRHLRGWRWLSNDLVNFISSAVGAGVATLLAVWLT